MAEKASKNLQERVVFAVNHDALENFLLTTAVPKEKYSLVHNRIDALIEAVRHIEVDIGITQEGELLVKRASEPISAFLEAADGIDRVTAVLKNIDAPRRRFLDNTKREFYVPEVGEKELREHLLVALTKVFSTDFLDYYKINYSDFVKFRLMPGTRPPLREPRSRSGDVEFNAESFQLALQREVTPLTAAILQTVAYAFRLAAEDLKPKRKGGGAKNNPVRNFLLANVAELWVDVFEGKRAAYVKDTNPFIDFAEGICELLKVRSYFTEHHAKEALKLWRAQKGRNQPQKKQKLSPTTK